MFSCRHQHIYDHVIRTLTDKEEITITLSPYQNNDNTLGLIISHSQYHKNYDYYTDKKQSNREVSWHAVVYHSTYTGPINVLANSA